jgi:hypothetical protein
MKTVGVVSVPGVCRALVTAALPLRIARHHGCSRFGRRDGCARVPGRAIATHSRVVAAGHTPAASGFTCRQPPSLPVTRRQCHDHPPSRQGCDISAAQRPSRRDPPRARRRVRHRWALLSFPWVVGPVVGSAERRLRFSGATSVADQVTAVGRVDRQPLLGAWRSLGCCGRDDNGVPCLPPWGVGIHLVVGGRLLHKSGCRPVGL